MPDNSFRSRKQSQCVDGKSPGFPDVARLLIHVSEQWHAWASWS